MAAANTALPILHHQPGMAKPPHSLLHTEVNSATRDLHFCDDDEAVPTRQGHVAEVNNRIENERLQEASSGSRSEHIPAAGARRIRSGQWGGAVHHEIGVPVRQQVWQMVSIVCVFSSLQWPCRCTTTSRQDACAQVQTSGRRCAEASNCGATLRIQIETPIEC